MWHMNKDMMKYMMYIIYIDIDIDIITSNVYNGQTPVLQCRTRLVIPVAFHVGRDRAAHEATYRHHWRNENKAILSYNVNTHPH